MTQLIEADPPRISDATYNPVFHLAGSDGPGTMTLQLHLRYEFRVHSRDPEPIPIAVEHATQHTIGDRDLIVSPTGPSGTIQPRVVRDISMSIRVAGPEDEIRGGMLSIQGPTADPQTIRVPEREDVDQPPEADRPPWGDDLADRIEALQDRITILEQLHQ
jgi:hypothetical protein